MTLLVRNEGDILRDNIEFHLRMGVDYIFATDNGSTDNTVEILNEYVKKGILTLVHEPKQDYAQAKWVNRMADMAFEQFGPCFIFHCDADEFWFSKSGNLKNELATYPLVDCLAVKVNNVLLRFNNFLETFPEDAVLDIVNPLSTNDIRQDSIKNSMYIFPYPDKAFYRANKYMPHVTGGNHRLVERKISVTKESRDITVYHFPIRSFAQFTRKVIEGGSAIVSNPDLAPAFGWHWRRWYQQYIDGTLQEAYRLLVLDNEEAATYAARNVLVINENLPKKLGIRRN